MVIDWSPLRQELAASRRDGVSLPFWWRDDDAIAPTPALKTLASLAQDTGMQPHLAVVPARATPELVAFTTAHRLVPVVHGWAHRDHSGPNEKKNEFMTDRADLADDSARGLARMQSLFRDALSPMFVPPWNRIRPALLPILARQGFTALSTYGPRGAPEPVAGLTQINTHVDPIWWKGTRDLVEPETFVRDAAAHVRARRQGHEDAGEPFGLLTHHLVHTPLIWEFTRAFIEEMLSGGAEPWTTENTQDEQT